MYSHARARARVCVCWGGGGCKSAMPWEYRLVNVLERGRGGVLDTSRECLCVCGGGGGGGVRANHCSPLTHVCVYIYVPGMNFLFHVPFVSFLQSLEASLRALKTDYIDLYQVRI